MTFRPAVVIFVTQDPYQAIELAAEVRSAVSLPIFLSSSISNFTPVSQIDFQVIASPAEDGARGVFVNAVSHLLDAGFTHMIAMDSAAAEFASEIHKLVGAALVHPKALVLGRRKGMRRPIPFAEHDWQARLRLYPLECLRGRVFKSWIFDFDTKVLVTLLLKGVPIEETEIAGHHMAPPSFWRSPFARLNAYWRETVLLTLSLLRSHYSPKEAALALGIGAFVGSSPFFGFHMMIIAAAAFLFRLNFIFMFIGSHVSTPVLAPFLIAACVYVGHHWLQVGMSGGAMARFYQWFAGSLVVGSGLGVSLGLITYFVVSGLQRVKGRRKPD